MLDTGEFRRDLFHRIADWVVELPPLRQRREDIPNLAVHFLGAACREAGVAPAGISRAALDVLTRAAWPGNIRQLEREMSRVALFLEDGDLLESTLLQPSLAVSGDEILMDGSDYRELMDAADIVPYEKVTIYDITNGQRISTYAIEGASGSGVLCINGAAAHRVHTDDLVILASYAQYDEAEIKGHQPKIVLVDRHNRPRESTHG